MVIMNILHKVGDVFQKLGDSVSNDPLIIGKQFEDHVESLFNERVFKLVEKTHSPQTNTKRFVESSLKPDFIWRFEPTKERFAVECKFRTEKSINKDDRLSWTSPAQLQRYREFQNNEKIPVFVVIGLELPPDDAEEEYGDEYCYCMFCLPLEVAKYPSLYPSVLEKYQRPWDKKFYWRNGTLS